MKTKTKQNGLWRLLTAPTRIFNTRIRLSFGLAASVVSIVMLAQLTGVLPDSNQPRMDARKLQTETLAIAGSAIAESTNGHHEFETTLQYTLDRCEDVVSIGLRKTNGELAISVGEHDDHWQTPTDGRSNDQFMFVPIYRNGLQIGQLELCYTPLRSVSSWLNSPAGRLGGFMFVLSFISFNFLLQRTLKQLDPRGAVPQRVREAFDNMAEGLLILDRNGNIMLANSKFGSIVGTNAGKLTGVQVANFEWQLADDELPWARAIRDQKPVNNASLHIEDVDSGLRTFNVSASPILGHQGSSRGVMVTFDDITVLEEHKRDLIKARNEADAANQSKSNFLSRMSHEIRTPMNAIIGYTDVLQQDAVSRDDQVKYLTTIQSSGEHLLSLINDILDLSKVEAGQMTIERRDIRLVPLLQQVIDTLVVKSNEKNLSLDLEVTGQIPSIVETDETRLRQILLNVVGNAIKFTGEGGVKLFVLMEDIDGQKMLRFDVVDSGIGMSKSALDNIFDPFTQADNSVTRRFGGTGLGLAISKQLSESLGGEITVKSEEGAGTVFTITIDPGCIDDSVAWITSENLVTEKAVVPSQKRPRVRFEGHVLIVDDGVENREIAALMLKRLGLSFDFATNGLEALEKIEGCNYDVVLMDVNMPVMDGMTATRKIREAGLKIPVVALTALAVEEDMNNCLAAGCNSFLAKPVRPQLLADALSEFLPCVHEEIEQIPETPGDDTQPRKTSTESSLDETLASLGSPADSGDTCLQKSKNGLVLPEVVRSSLGDDPELQDIAASFAERLPAKLEEFDDAAKKEDIKKLNELGHWLVGAAGTIGFEAFTTPARELEYADGTDKDRINALLKHLKGLCERISVEQTSEAY